MQKEVKIDMGHLPVNLIISQFLYVKIAAIIFFIFVYVNICCSATYIFPNFFKNLAYYIVGIFSSF